MSEAQLPSADLTGNPVEPAAASTPLSDAARAGAALRSAREAAGMHLAALASTIKVPIAKLEALEAGRLDELHDPVFVRALTGSVCRAIRTDPAPILQLLPPGSVPQLPQEKAAINAPFRKPGESTRPSMRDVLTRPGALVVFALLVAAFVLLLLPEVTGPGSKLPASRSTDGIPESRGLAAGGAAPGSDAPGVATPVPPVPPLKDDAAKVSAPGSPVGRADAFATPGAALAERPSVAASSMLVIQVRGLSWVEVTDGQAGVLVRRNLEAGELVNVEGVAPLRVIVGRAAEATVKVRGQPFDLGPVTRDNVARFEVR